MRYVTKSASVIFPNQTTPQVIKAKVPKLEWALDEVMFKLEAAGRLYCFDRLNATVNHVYIESSVYQKIKHECPTFTDSDFRLAIQYAMYIRKKGPLSSTELDQLNKPLFNLIDESFADLAKFVFTTDKKTHDPNRDFTDPDSGRQLYCNLEDFVVSWNERGTGFRYHGTVEGRALAKRATSAAHKKRNLEILRILQHGPKGSKRLIRCAYSGKIIEKFKIPHLNDFVNIMDIHHLFFNLNRSNLKGEAEPSKLLVKKMADHEINELMGCVFLYHPIHKYIHQEFTLGQDLSFWVRYWSYGKGIPTYALCSEENYNEVCEILESKYGYKDYRKQYPYQKLIADLMFGKDKVSKRAQTVIDNWFTKNIEAKAPKPSTTNLYSYALRA